MYLCVNYFSLIIDQNYGSKCVYMSLKKKKTRQFPSIKTEIKQYVYNVKDTHTWGNKTFEKIRNFS